MMAVPRDFMIRMISKRRSFSREVRDEVGSSKMTILVLPSSVRAISTIC